MDLKKLKIILFLNSNRGIILTQYLIKKKIVPLKAFVHKETNIEILKNLKILNINFEKFSQSESDYFFNEIKKQRIDLFIVSGFPTILKHSFFNLPRLGTINLHAGYLPDYRGGSPLNWQIINGEKKIGISIVKMNQKIDQGNILVRRKFALKLSEDISDAHKKANYHFTQNIIKAITMLINNDKGIVQKSNQGVYYHQRSDEDGLIDWKRKSFEIINFIRALTHPYPGAFTFFNKKRVRIFKVKKVIFKVKGNPGKFFRLQNDGLFVVCADMALEIIEYVMENNVKLKRGTFSN